MQQVKQQTSGIVKGSIKQIAQEPLEIVKDIGEQVGVIDTQQAPPRKMPTELQKGVQPSPEERSKTSRLAAIEQELQEMRAQRVKQEQEKKLAEENSAAEAKKQAEVAKKSQPPLVPSAFKRGLSLVTGRLKKRAETRLPKAA